MEHADLVATLRDPAFYGAGVENVEFLQTHISSVFLTGERAYKLKKPVNFGFLDFSTRELRKRYCEAEVELNRRLAPRVYLGIEPITRDGARLRLGGAGEVVDWVVVMKQLDQELLGLRVLARGELSAAHIDQLVSVLVPFYRAAQTGAGVDDHGALEAVRFNTDENFAQTEAQVGKLLARERYQHIRDWTDRFYRERPELFARRIAEGWIRESHGDLHLGNMFLYDPPVIFDCIEFNERFRCGDVAADLAFLAMDLDFRGRPDLGQHLVDAYVEAAGDRTLHEVLDFYKCYRAYVRGKVCGFTATDPALTAGERRAQRNLARHYFGLAYRYAGGTSRPALIVVYGMMGTGKTSVASWLRETFGWHVLSTDSVRKQISGVGENTRVYVPYGAGLYSPEMNRRTYGEVCQRAEHLLEGGFPVVIDGAFKRRSERLPVVEAAERAGARLLFVETTCAVTAQRDRLERRQQHDTRSDGRVELMDRQRVEFEPPDPGLGDRYASISTEGSTAHTRRELLGLLESRGLVGEREDADTVAAG